MSIKDGTIVFDPTKVGNNAESCESLQVFMEAVTNGLPKLQNVPSDSAELVKQGMNIKDSYKEIIDKSGLGFTQKASALGVTALNLA